MTRMGCIASHRIVSHRITSYHIASHPGTRQRQARTPVAALLPAHDMVTQWGPCSVSSLNLTPRPRRHDARHRLPRSLLHLDLSVNELRSVCELKHLAFVPGLSSLDVSFWPAFDVA